MERRRWRRLSRHQTRLSQSVPGPEVQRGVTRQVMQILNHIQNATTS